MHDNPFIRKLESYADISEKHKTVVEELTSENIETYPADVDIISDGDRPEHVHLIIEGWAARYKILHDGSRRIVGLLLPGDFCDLHITVLQQMDHGIMTLTPCRVAHLDSGKLDQLTTEDTTLTKALWFMTLVDEAVLRQWVINVGRTALAAVAHLLCEIHVRMRAVGLTIGNHVELPLTQEELADATGMTSVHVNRTLQSLRQAGLIELKGGMLFIPDVGALAKAGGFDDSYLHLREGRARRGE